MITFMWHRYPCLIGAALLVLAVAPATSAGPARRDPAQWPFSANSPWNTPIGSGAVFAGADDPCNMDLHDTSIDVWINAAEWSHPVYLAKATDPVVGIFRDGVLQVSVHVPVNAQPAGPLAADTDAHLHIIDPSHHFVDEMWRARPHPGGGWDADAYQRNDLYGPGVESGGVRAYGGSAIGGLIRRGELKSGIRHALALAQPQEKQRVGYVWPATTEDDFASTNYKGHIPIGQLIALPSTVRLEELDLGPQGMAIARALQDYGGYDVDSGAFTLYAEPAVENELGSAREDMPRIRPWLSCVTNNRPANVGGGGRRRAPPAPPLP